MRARAAPKPIITQPSSDKLAMIRSGKKKKTVTGFKEKKNITFTNKEGKFIAVEKEKKVMEEGVTRKKRNFIMFESKLGTERDRDMHKIGNVNRDVKPRERVEEKIIIKKKKKEYLDNYQYHETKQLSKAQPDLVIHKRWGDPVGGIFEEVTYEKTRSRQRGGSVDKSRNAPRPVFKQNKTSSVLRSRPASTGTGSKTIETSTKVGRRGGAGGKTSTTTRTERRISADSRGNRKIAFKSSTTRGRK